MSKTRDTKPQSNADQFNTDAQTTNDMFSLGQADAQTLFGSDNDLSAINTDGSGNVLGSDNSTFSSNAANVGNTVSSSNNVGSNNSMASGNAMGSGNTMAYTADMLSGNEVLSGNKIGSNNDIFSGNVKTTLEEIQELKDESETDVTMGAARDLLTASEEAEIVADDISVSMNSLMGDGNDARVAAENTNDLDDTDSIEDIALNLGPAAAEAQKDSSDDREYRSKGDDEETNGTAAAGGQVFEQTVTAQAEKATVGDGMDEGQTLAGVTGDVALNVAIGASAAASAMADGAAQDVRSGANTALNQGTIAAVGGSEAVDLSESMSVTGSGDGNTVTSNNTENSNNTATSGNALASNNVVGADNTLASGNDVLTGNDAFSSNSTLSENDVAVDRSFGSDNEIASNNSILSDNAIGSNNVVTSETTKIEIENEAEISMDEVAATALVAADDEAEVLLDDLSVDYGTLTGAGNDMAFDLDQANTLVDADTIDDISLTLAGSFEQTVEATAGEAYADDATDGGAGTMLSDIIGNVAIDVQNTADASAVANAQGITQTIASGGNVMLNSLDMSITGGDSSFAQTADDIIA